MALLHSRWKTLRGERGYPWLFFHHGRSRGTGLLVTLLVTGVSCTFYLWYRHFGNDVAPDSPVGYVYAIAGTVCFVLASTHYMLRRRLHRHTTGQLHAALSWHVFFAIMALVLLILHSFGNFNARTGTYALYSMIALMVSGFVGRGLDHFVPRLMAMEVDKMVAAQGDEQAETTSQKLLHTVEHSTQRVHSSAVSLPPAGGQRIQALSTSPLLVQGFPGIDDKALTTPWDLAYIPFEVIPQEVRQEGGHHRFTLERKSAPVHPGGVMPGGREQIQTLHFLQQAAMREQFYRYIIRYWRVCHGILAMLTVGLVIWHLCYVAELLALALLRPT
jgi:hypothetical protein